MKDKPRIFTIGGATFDIFVQAADQAIVTFETPDTRRQWLCLGHGAKIKIQDVVETYGGGATNTAVAFARMGFDTSAIIKAGKDEYGDGVIANLKNEGIRTDFAKQTSRDKTSFSNIINTFDGDRTVLAYPGASCFLDHKSLPVKELEKADWIFLNHLTEKSSRIPHVLISILKKNPHIKLAWNPGHEQITQGVSKWHKLLEHTDILLLNKEEASLFAKTPYQLAGIKKDDPNEHIHIARKFLPPYADDVSEIMIELFKYGVKNVVITDGRNGAQASDGNILYFCPVVSRKRVDTLGAGDAFGSGFTSAMILGKDLKKALIYGTLNASSVVSCFGAQKGLLTVAEMKKRFRSQHLRIRGTSLLFVKIEDALNNIKRKAKIKMKKL